MKPTLFRLFSLCSALSTLVSTALGQGTAFIYQGRLMDGASPANGTYDLRFRLAADSQANTYVGSSFLAGSQHVSNGLFSVTLDFGPGIFNGSNYWLEVDVRTNGATTYTALNPLQAVTPSPYALFAGSAATLAGALPNAALAGVYSSPVAFSSPGNSFAGSGAGLLNLNAAQLSAGTVPDARLSTNVALLNASQSFTGVNNLTNRANTIYGNFFGSGAGLTGLTTGPIWQIVSGAAVQAAANSAYLLTNSQRVTVTLPASPSVGDTVRVLGAGANGWKLVQNPGQSILGSGLLNNLYSAWTTISGGSFDYAGSVVISGDGTRLAAVGFDGIYLSTNLGAGLTLSTAPSVYWTSIACSADGTRLVAVASAYVNSPGTNVTGLTPGGIYTSADGGSTWGLSSAPVTNFWVSVASSANGTRLVAAARTD
jgi:hypothetical protein